MSWERKLLGALGILCGFGLFFALRIAYVQYKTASHIFTPHVVNLTLQPPAGALTAQITNLSGVAKKEGRKDTDFQTITKSTTLLQGESFATASTGLGTIVFPHVVTLIVSRNTEIDYLNGLPGALVIRQPNGTVMYTTTGTISPFSMRSLALLTQWSDKAKITITTNTAYQTVLVKAVTGEATVAYADANNNTKVQKLITGDSVLFDNTASTLTVE